jgi:hypothetical protein
LQYRNADFFAPEQGPEADLGDGEVSSPTGESANAAEHPTGSASGSAAPAVVDDPETEIDTGVKLKRSELRDLYTRRKELDRGSFEKMQEAARIRKEAAADKAQAQEIVGALSKDTKAALRSAGIDPYAFAEQVLAEKLEEFQLSPAEKELRELKAEKARRDAEDAERAEQDQQTKAAAAVSQWEQRFDQAFTGAIQTVGLPKTARVVARMAEKVESYWGAGVQVPLEEIAAEIKQDLIAERRELLSSVKDEHLGDLYEDAELDRARKLILRKAQGSAQPTKPIAPRKQQRKAPGRGLTQAEISARIDQRLGIAK